MVRIDGITSFYLVKFLDGCSLVILLIAPYSIQKYGIIDIKLFLMKGITRKSSSFYFEKRDSCEKKKRRIAWWAWYCSPNRVLNTSIEYWIQIIEYWTQ